MKIDSIPSVRLLQLPKKLPKMNGPHVGECDCEDDENPFAECFFEAIGIAESAACDVEDPGQAASAWALIAIAYATIA